MMVACRPQRRDLFSWLVRESAAFAALSFLVQYFGCVKGELPELLKRTVNWIRLCLTEWIQPFYENENRFLDRVYLVIGFIDRCIGISIK